MKPCHNCGSNNWWWRQNRWALKGEWLCGTCHPEVKNEMQTLPPKSTPLQSIDRTPKKRASRGGKKIRDKKQDSQAGFDNGG